MRTPQALFCIFLLILSLMASADKQPEPSKPTATPVSFHWYEFHKQIPSDDSPIGYWEEDIRYPVFEGPNSTIAALNARVKALSDDIRCENGGDLTVTVSVEFVSEDRATLAYERMWMCPKMPGPDSDDGVVDFEMRKDENK